jgi:hypothetical protein
MGMFDYIKCLYPLPGKNPFGAEGEYQTKSLDSTLEIYTITEDGLLLGRDGSKPLDYTGYVEFYASNVAGSGPGLYTPDGADAVAVDYRAKFLDGKLQEIEETSYSVEPALPAKQMRYEPEPDYVPIPEDLARAYVLWGSLHRDSKGYYGQVLARSGNQLCLKVEGDGDGGFHCEGDLELIDTRNWGRTLFLTEEDAFAHRDFRQAQLDRHVKEYEDYAAQWEEQVRD